MRLVFASLVLLSHAPQILDHGSQREPLAALTDGASDFGGLAVDGFFILSGYLIMKSWVNRPVLTSYFKNRVLRIYPGFVIALAISVLVVGPIATDASAYFARFKPMTFLADFIFLTQARWAYSFDGHVENVNGPLWTIKFEFACYIAVAIIGTLFSRRMNAVTLGITAAALVLHVISPELATLGLGVTALEIIRFASVFGCGASLFVLGFRTLSTAPLMACGLLFFASLFSHRIAGPGTAVFGALFLIALAYRWPKPNVFSSLPDISYGVYLYGWPVQMLLIWKFASLGPWIIFLLSLVGALCCGYASWTLVEARFMRMKDRVGKLPTTS